MYAFLPVVLAVYFFLNKKRFVFAAKVWLISSSIFYYAWFNLSYAPLLLVTMFGNYFLYSLIKKYQAEASMELISEVREGLADEIAGNIGIATKIETKKYVNANFDKAKIVLIVGVTLNILLLAYFKYANFLVDNINEVFHSDIYLFKILLPVGISFFTFQQIAFLVDNYKDKNLHYEFINYASFITFFPHLFAGPILHHSEMIPQFKSVRTKVLNYKNLMLGIFIFLIGFYKKVYLVGLLKPAVMSSFPILSNLTTIEAWYFNFLEAFHAYFDFSSYMDMAIGTALMFNIKLPINFNSPYQSKSIAEFWNRWHMTLTRFLREYVYFPLGGNRKGEAKANRNVLLTFVIGGIWHGASWCTIAWGVFHGVGLIIYKYWKKLNIKIPEVVSIVCTFVFVSILGLLIRVQDFGLFTKIFKAMFSLNFVLPSFTKGMVLFSLQDGIHNWSVKPIIVVLLAILVTCLKKSVEGVDLAKNFKPNLIYLLVVAAAIAGTFFISNQPQPFLYYQF